VQNGFGALLVHATQLRRRHPGARMVAEGQQVLRQLQVQGVIIVLVILGFESSCLGQAHVLGRSRGVDAILARQALVEGLQQLPAGSPVVFGQGDGDLGPQRAVGAQAVAARVLVP